MEDKTLIPLHTKVDEPSEDKSFLTPEGYFTLELDATGHVIDIAGYATLKNEIRRLEDKIKEYKRKFGDL